MLVFDQLKRDDPHLRLLSIAVLVGVCVLLAGLWWVQIVKAREYQTSLETQSVRSVRIPAVRGKILDRNGNPLAENRPNYNISLYLEELREDFEGEFKRQRPKILTNTAPFWKRWLGLASGSTKPQFARLTKAQDDALKKQARYAVVSNVVLQVSQRLRQPIAFTFSQFQHHYTNSLSLPCPVAEKMGPEQIARFEEQATNLRGVDLEIQATRYYPNGALAAHLLGFVRRDPSSIEGEQSYYYYRLPDYRGIIGIEGGFDPRLHGHAGAKSVLINNLGYRQDENIWETPEAGSNVFLTIDLDIQRASEAALKKGPLEANTRGAVVVMDVHTGDVLTLASNPAFDPNDYASGFTIEGYKKMQDSGAEHNRATYEIYAPGSIFKPIVGLALLEAGLNTNATIYNPGFTYVGRRRIGDLAPPGEYNFRRAIVKSCNTYFITNGLKLGIERIVRLAQHLHFGERCLTNPWMPDSPTRQESRGTFPSLKRIQSNDWREGLSANICIGQGEIAVTPLQVAVMTAAIANGGTVLWPRLVDRIESQDPMPGEKAVVPFPKGCVRDRLEVSERSLKIVHDAMLGETEDSEGTGKAARVPGMRICGKTGTAEVQNEQAKNVGKITWFASFAPYENPRYAVVVMVENGDFGGTTCAPIAHEVYLAIQKSEQRTAKLNVAKN